MENVTIEIMENGPLIVSGLKNFQNSKGQALSPKDRIALCRCGESANKPYCDGSHTAAKFSGIREIDKSLTKEKIYEGKEISIHDNRVICCHATECVEQLSSVFRLEERPWIDPDRAEVETIIEVIKKCPSGALSYTINEKHYRDQDREPAIQIAKNGPYDVSGDVALKVAEGLQPPSKEHYSLCRCGASKNKPFCDGAHRDIDFSDEGN